MLRMLHLHLHRQRRSAVAFTLAAIAFASMGAASVPASLRAFREEPVDASRPVEVFAALDGLWRGNFVGYDSSGRELYRISVEQKYWTVDANTQKVEIKDTSADGTVTSGEGENIARIGEDGKLELRCVVRKSNGDRVEHRGRIAKGPDGDKQIVWYSIADDRTETFRESVRREGDAVVYSIDGMGRYGSTSILMSGRYKKHEPEPADSDGEESG